MQELTGSAQPTVNPNLLFAGTELGLFVSLDGGNDWAPLGETFPQVGVRDLDVTHPGRHAPGIGLPGEPDEDLDTARSKSELIDTAVGYEIRYAQDCLPNGVLGLNAQLFDAADANNVAAVRNETTVSSQAAFLLNNPFSRGRASAFAERVLKSSGDDATRIAYAYRLALQRSPTATESGEAVDGPSEFRILPRSGESEEA